MPRLYAAPCVHPAEVSGYDAFLPFRTVTQRSLPLASLRSCRGHLPCFDYALLPLSRA